MQKDFDQGFPSEAELEEGLGGLTDPGIGMSACPTPAVLRDFVAGKYARDEMATEKMLVHLAACGACEAVLAQIHVQLPEQQTQSRQPFTWRWPVWKMVFVASSIAVLVLLMTWFLTTRDRAVSVATLDLQHITRGDGSSPSLTLHRNESRVRILLPTGSVVGRYEVGLFQRGSVIPLVSSFAETVLVDDSLAITVPLSVKAVSSGQYLLGIRSKEFEWVYYPIRLD